MLGGRRQIIFIHPAAAICVSAVCLLFLSGDGEGLQVKPAKDNGCQREHLPHAEGCLADGKDLADQAGDLERLEDGSAILATLSLYSEETGLSLEVDCGKAFFV